MRSVALSICLTVVCSNQHFAIERARATKVSLMEMSTRAQVYYIEKDLSLALIINEFNKQ